MPPPRKRSRKTIEHGDQEEAAGSTNAQNVTVSHNSALDNLHNVLSEYNASLSASDQKILFTLRSHESNFSSILNLKTISWGEPALEHYRSQFKKPAIKQQKIEEVLELFSKERVRETLRKYPLDLVLNSTDLAVESEIYDPRFYLPLLYHLVSPQNLINCHKFVELNGLALAITALSSEDDQTRQIGYSIISRYYHHLESSTFYKDRMLWISFLDNVRTGMKVENQKLTRTISVFLVEAIEILMNPDNIINEPIRGYLTQITGFDENNVVKLLTGLLKSTDLKKHQKFSDWSLRLIGQSLQTEDDFLLFQRHKVFDQLMKLSQSALTNTSTKLKIMMVFETAFEMRIAIEKLAQESAITTWLLLEVTDRKLHHYESNDKVKLCFSRIVTRICSVIVKRFKKFEKNPDSVDAHFAYDTFEDEMLLILSYLTE